MKQETEQKSSANNINIMALNYMEEKYGEKFEYICPWGNSLSGTHQLMVSCDSLSGQNILVDIENYKSGDRVFRDNYLAVKYQEETKQYFADCANKVFENSVVFYEASKQTLSADLPPNATFEEFLMDNNSFLVGTIVVSESSFVSREQVSEVFDSILAACNARYLSIATVVVQDTDFEVMDQTVFNRIREDSLYIRCATMTRQDGREHINWMGEE